MAQDPSTGPAPPALPEVLPVFPLTGVLLLPGTALPLEVFEPRYRNLLEDVLAAERVFGMIQPFAPQQDNRPLPGAERETPELYGAGCAGYVEHSEQDPDGRYLIRLRGRQRFRVVEELPLHRGYRRIRADYGAFPQDGDPPGDFPCERERLTAALMAYGKNRGMEIGAERIAPLSDLDLIDSAATGLPFHPSEKQALLEAPTLAERASVLLGLLELGGQPPSEGAEDSGPVN